MSVVSISDGQLARLTNYQTRPHAHHHHLQILEHQTLDDAKVLWYTYQSYQNQPVIN